MEMVTQHLVLGQENFATFRAFFCRFLPIGGFHVILDTLKINSYEDCRESNPFGDNFRARICDNFSEG